ncbi:MAG: SAM-dependent methyltransferase [Alphaproteobacteria bacterium HGW-Alphaproteobacteria-5]|nr:MAG: SAM-dependent methyltransferase [Alphaproteobacteria bacterium HGW-Alphaproteobacteria-5]
MWSGLLDKKLRATIRRGTLALEWPDGATRVYGDGSPLCKAKMANQALVRRLVLQPELALGEAYMDGSFLVEGDDLFGFMSLIFSNWNLQRKPTLDRPGLVIEHALRKLQQLNSQARSRANVAHHYDLSIELFRHFLDSDLQYSCAYFRDPSDSLELAQAQKKAMIAAKLLLQPGQRVLDIGCGWGGLALSLARDHGVSVLGITLSSEQAAYATERAKKEGLDGRVSFRLADFRALRGQFDRVVSVGMFEHVGVPHYRGFFAAVRELLTEDGVALIHTIGRAGAPSSTGPWTRKYIFPGGYIPSMSEVAAAIEHQDLWPTDIEIWRLHYAETLRHWRARFDANKDLVAALYDERFCRMWRFYLVAAELSFRQGRQAVFQVQLARRQDAVPLTRDYLYRDRATASDRLAAQ